MPGVGPKTEQRVWDRVQDGADLVLNLDRSADMRVQGGSHPFVGDRLRRRPHGVDRALKSRRVEAGADRRVALTLRRRAVCDEHLGVAEVRLQARVALGRLGDLNGVTNGEVGTEVAGSGAQAILGQQPTVARGVEAGRWVGVDGTKRRHGDLGEG
jgi:hypothetical protein